MKGTERFLMNYEIGIMCLQCNFDTIIFDKTLKLQFSVKCDASGVIDAVPSAIVVVNQAEHQFDYESFMEVFCWLPRTKKT